MIRRSASENSEAAPSGSGELLRGPTERPRAGIAGSSKEPLRARAFPCNGQKCLGEPQSNAR
eukprot:1729809-Alexandrium_andersonii.AAC.1